MSFLSGPNTGLIRRLEGIDRPPAIPNAMDDEFYGNALDTGKWSWLDQGGAAASVSDGRLTITLTETANRIRGIYQTAPGGAFEFTAALPQSIVTTTNTGSHSTLFVGQGAGASDDQHGLSWWTGILFFPLTWASPSSTAAAWNNQPANATRQRAYFRLAWNGSNLLTGYWSQDGVTWTEAASSNPGYTPAIVGLGIGNNAGDRSLHFFDWFRRTG